MQPKPKKQTPAKPGPSKTGQGISPVQSVLRSASTAELMRELSRRTGVHFRTVDKAGRYVIDFPEPVYSLIVPKGKDKEQA